MLDLIGVRTSVQFQGARNITSLNSPFSADRTAMGSYLPKLLDNTTVSADPAIAGRININQAPRVVLAGIPGMTPDLLDQIIAKRVPDRVAANPNHRYETWILTEGIVPLAAMKTLMPYINAGGSVYRAEAVGFFDGGGPTAHVEAIFDAGKRPTSLLFWRDVSHLGIGYTPDMARPETIE